MISPIRAAVGWKFGSSIMMDLFHLILTVSFRGFWCLGNPGPGKGWLQGQN